MKKYIALFRGINVGGHNKLPMQALRDIFVALDCANVQTYIQSGNVVFEVAGDPAKLDTALETAIDDRFGFRPQVLVLDVKEFAAIAAANPYTAAEQHPQQLHISFLAAAPTAPDLASLESLRSPTESFELIGKAFYLHAPDGIGRSKLAAKVEKALGVAATGRNWRTVSKLLALAAGFSD